MNVDFTEEQRLVQLTIRGLMKRHLPISLVRELQQPHTSGHAEGLWDQLAADGWLGLAIPEEYGGSGATFVDLGILYEESGRALVPTTLYSTTHAALLFTALGTEAQRRDYLRRIAAGEAISTVAYAEPGVIHNSACFATRATRIGDRWVLSGQKAFVLNAHLADPLLVVACTETDGRDGLTVFLIPRAAPGVTIQPHSTSAGDRQSVVRLEGVHLGAEAVLGGEAAVGRAKAAITLATRQATALQCAEMTGGMQQILEMTLQYVSERDQFGRPIGSFQAVHHHAANMATAVDGARLIAYYSLWLLANGAPAEAETAMAKAWASDAYISVSLMAHQLWGGMGYALESDLYLWSNRAKATELSFGTRDHHLQNLARLVLDTAS